MSGCLIDLPEGYEMHLNKSCVRLVRNKKILKEELFFRPEMQYQAVLRVQEFLKQYKAGELSDAKIIARYEDQTPPEPPRAA